MTAADGSDDPERRAYWTSQLNAAHRFMVRMLEYPVCECGEPAVSLREAVHATGVTVRFSDTLIAGVFPRLFLLREGLIAPFVAAVRDLSRRGWVLTIEDGYRTTEMQRQLSLAPYVLDRILAKVVWECGGRVPPQDLLFRRLTALTATSPKIGTHMSASAVDISVTDLGAGGELDRGGPYLEMSERTPMQSPFIAEPAARNRALISLAMGSHGFMAYPYEFWHYNQGDAYDEYLTGSGKPGRYGAVDVDPKTGRVTPLPDPCATLHPPDSFEAAMAGALERLAGSRQA